VSVAPLLFPSEAWARAAAEVLHQDASAQAALAAFGPFTAGCVVEKGDGLERDLCVWAKLVPGRKAELVFCDDEDELDDLRPDYFTSVPHALVRELMRAVLAGQAPDGLGLVRSGRVQLKGDLARVVKMAGLQQHRHAGLAALRSLPTKLLG
jgi:hypothetical protein